MSKKKDLTGSKFGKITVLSEAESETKSTYWHCRCDCGKNIKLSTRKLKSNKIIDCGFCGKTRRDKSTFLK